MTGRLAAPAPDEPTHRFPNHTRVQETQRAGHITRKSQTMKHVSSLALLLALGTSTPLALAQSVVGAGGATVCLTATGSSNSVTPDRQQ